MKIEECVLKGASQKSKHSVTIISDILSVNVKARVIYIATPLASTS